MERVRSVPTCIHFHIRTVMSIEQMYKVTRRENAQWGVEGYEVHKVYQDPAKQIEERKFATQEKGIQPIFIKGKKASTTITRRGHFLDDLVK